MNLFIINTNKSTNTRYEIEMLEEQKCAAYRSTKTDIEHIQKNDIVLLYSNERGIIASGRADGIVNRKPDLGEEDAEYFMKLQDFNEYVIEIPNKKLLGIIKGVNPSFSKILRNTMEKFTPPVSDGIWKEVSRYV
ncbi:hypothetical protein CEF21_21505 [Bacillus sp. FJAT-42376]|uniref:hypothetical protein n=1 Tax=Bacillus sp. FJAT-42376 TaxID=2014076 RepID=UPI000F507032|nr:hypothetical protein [Bacillus sp. FJAT-42376]AZB44658.1 hypothetical protein CEF21_21505 [Bacillus sp. FJAT-42376]